MHQLQTVRHDCTSGAANLDLNTTLTTPVPINGSAKFFIVNEGAGAARVNRSDDTVPSALEIPAGQQREAGPYPWPGGIPILVGDAGSNCRITPFVSSSPS